jgi:hypothetical protein
MRFDSSQSITDGLFRYFPENCPRPAPDRGVIRGITAE